ncbi:exodeoxyribonuclease VII, large subunit [Ehrlichia chaffeensis str. Heartland]|uniref:Exodeoxyribonuclease 7 large subunit n=1 Tax=Ehrlichia chaffeensis (strain ATCC CRL-10679 / Arkansas) TaxID=205920 RepID=Q2GI46_EHRCR|nr:exodeoxyribonuclease VII large subunit [Ehrlichia chaffeensis]ABD44857.1 putative exodeoxyribonuclease VII, large subunit [Ehrlichia chaffeensis str. Arkansas]AHX04127.1 exodeoxyribonuclease VII, large subunit [Ehrlichia chaffeensis str. Heartland]AHX06063.1 exodeoxyribonuclease VII, large subunit [Ehrlichia chaffeensis str. Jax]AHX07053.1 exodeoxyribonuclease VII, large subunit [Ehrlichia chaffeensis str. Liberty]AHX07281.1 exodeoxyribonuclease VII, large subunit [Ehrlichia chaffeensis str
MTPEFTVSEITKIFQNFVHETFTHIKVRGEISNLSQPKSGHTYFTLKDDAAVLNAICWNNTKVEFDLKNGLEVICSGFLTTYQSKYQLITENMLLAGIGNLKIMLEQRKAKLEKEGLFDQSNKKPLPLLPKITGVITSTTGAVINDILNRVKSRFPSHIVISPVSVQGNESINQIIDAISKLNNADTNKPDVIIIARGGGSIEDLWIFNDESIVRAVARSSIPIVSAIGHETDFTLIDYAADVRAPTPTAAVEIVLPTKTQLIEHINSKFNKIKTTLHYKINKKKERLFYLHNNLIKTKHQIKVLKLQLSEYKNKIEVLLKILLLNKKQSLNALYNKINKFNKEKTLEAGYAVLYDTNRNHISSIKKLKSNDIISIELKDGIIEAIIK